MTKIIFVLGAMVLENEDEGVVASVPFEPFTMTKIFC
jgi:hypothetical protein